MFLASCSDDTITGSGRLVTETRDVSDFTSISSEGVFEINITESETQSVEVTADDNIIHNVKTTVSGKELSLYLKGDSYERITLQSNLEVVGLNGISNTGVGNINAVGVNNEGEFRVYNSGTADIMINGESTDLKIMNEGTGDFKGFDFEVNSCEIENVGTGDIEVNCSESLDITITGSGDIYYKGHPTINVKISGSGKVVDAN
jgi:hypothetical protein